jgi:hypothetical protein
VPTLKEWQVQFMARADRPNSGEFGYDVGYVGLSAEPWQAPNPPAAPGATVDVCVVSGQRSAVSDQQPGTLGTLGTSLAFDVRSGAARRQTWTIAVATPTPGQEVTLSWPDLNVSLPPGQRMTLRDLDSGETRFLATTSNYRFRSVEQPRLFEVTYEPARSGGLVISNVTMQASRAAGPARFGFHLSDGAETTVEITSLTGRPVRLVEEQVARAAGTQVVSWAYVDERGAPVPNGAYLVRITAVDPEGRPTQAVRVVTVGP